MTSLTDGSLWGITCHPGDDEHMAGHMAGVAAQHRRPWTASQLSGKWVYQGTEKNGASGHAHPHVGKTNVLRFLFY